MVFLADGACVFRASTLIHEMVNVCDVAQWFRDATSDRRLEALCRLLDCCMPMELQFLNTYLDEMLRRNFVVNQQADSMPELQEITDSTCRRQLCLILTRLKSANVLASCIYNILIQYNFSEFFSRVMVMEEELVDEILLLFTLASNHPAMTFSQRRDLHQRLVDLRETIDKSFKCYHATDVCCEHNQEYICKPLEKSSTQDAMNVKEQPPPIQAAETQNVEPNSRPPENSSNPDVPASKYTSKVHIKDLRVVRVQQRTFDKKYEYIFEVTWSNGKMVRIHRAYGELFDFQCKLRRRFSKEISKMTERKVIPYLPARRPIKFCKGNQVLPDITHYVREFTKLPEKLLHSESVETFFSDGTEKILSDEKQQNSKTKQNSSHEKKDHANTTCKHTDVSRVNVDVKSDKGAGSIKNHSPKGRCSTSFSGRKFNSSLQTSGKLESKRRPALSPRSNSHDTALSPKDRNKTNVHHQPRTILKSPNTLCTQFSTTDKTNNGEEIKTDSALAVQNTLCAEKLQPERTTSDDTHLKASVSDSSETDTPNSRTEIDEKEKLDFSASVSTSSSPSSETSVVVSPLAHSLTKVTSSTAEISLADTSSTHAAPGSLVTTAPSTLTSPVILSGESAASSITSPISSPATTTVLTATVSSFAPSTVTSSAVTSSTPTSSAPVAPISSSSVGMPSTSNSLALIPFTSSFIDSAVSNITPSTPFTITSPTLHMITSFTKPIMTSFSIPSVLTVNPPQAPLTVAVPVHSPPSCVTCSSPNQSSSEGSAPSSLSRTPLTSPAIPRTFEDTKGYESAKFSFDQSTFNGSTCLSPSMSCNSPESKFCECEKLDRDSNDDQAVDACSEEIETRKRQRLKATINDLRSTSGKNGYASHNISQHGLLIVPNGYNHLHSPDPNLLYNSYESHPTEPNDEEGFYEDGFTALGAKTDDKNCNYIFQNGGHHQALDFNSNNSYECKYTVHPYLNQKSNGFSKPFCYNCGEYGHHGSQCSARDLEESVVS